MPPAGPSGVLSHRRGCGWSDVLSALVESRMRTSLTGFHRGVDVRHAGSRERLDPLVASALTHLADFPRSVMARLQRPPRRSLALDVVPEPCRAWGSRAPCQGRDQAVPYGLDQAFARARWPSRWPERGRTALDGARTTMGATHAV